MSSSHTRTHKTIARTAVVAMSTGVAALMITIPAPVQARPMFPLAPACDNWEIGPTAFAVVVDVNGGWLVEFYGWTGKSLTAVPGGRPAFAEHFTPALTTGPAFGNINGRAINMTVNWTEGPAAGHTHTFMGQIDDNGVASGTTTDSTGTSRTWHSYDKARCVTAPPPPPPAPPPAPAPPPSEITLRYDPPTLTGITAFVGITNNADKPTVDCAYDDGVSPPRPFTVTGSVESRIDIAGIPTGTVFHVTVRCDNGLTHSENKSF